MEDRKELEYFTGEGYKKGGIMNDSKFQRKFIIIYPEVEEGMIGFVSRFIEKKEINYSLHLYKLIDNESIRVNKEWWGTRDFMKIPKESKLGKDLIELEKKGAFKK